MPGHGFLPSCRYGEFGHAVLDRLLDNTIRRPPLYYIGCLREDQRDVAVALEEKVYKHWDSSESAPPARRPTEPISEPSLELLGWSSGAPVFPENLLQKFSEGSNAHADVLAMKKELVQALPDAGRRSSQRSETSTSRAAPARAAGRPDFGSMAVFCHLTPRGSLRKSTLRKAPSMWQGENIRVPKIVGG